MSAEGATLVDFGKHKGVRWTRVPVSYLKWMINAEHDQADRARAELDRRGTSVEDPGVQISGHAIDRFSQRRLARWHEHRIGDEGIHAFLVRVVKEAIDGVKPRGGKYHHRGMVLAIATDMAEPVLKSVM